MSDDEVVASDVPPRYLFSSFLPSFLVCVSRAFCILISWKSAHGRDLCQVGHFETFLTLSNVVPWRSHFSVARCFIFFLVCIHLEIESRVGIFTSHRGSLICHLFCPIFFESTTSCLFLVPLHTNATSMDRVLHFRWDEILSHRCKNRSHQWQGTPSMSSESPEILSPLCSPVYELILIYYRIQHNNYLQSFPYQLTFKGPLLC